MTGESKAGEESFTIRASRGTFWKRSITVSPECIQVIKSSGKIEVTCSLSEVGLASCEYWESRAGILGPVTTRKLILRFFDTKGDIVWLEETEDRNVDRVYVENFTPGDIEELAQAIATLRPDILVVLTTLDFNELDAQMLLSAPSGDWKCPHCQELNPISESLWKLQQARAVEKRAFGKVTIFGMVPPSEVPCAHCKGVVNCDDLALEKKGCFIATTALGSTASEQLVILQQFRDEYLHSTRLGRLFIAGYYRISPPIAAVISRHPRFRVLVRNWLVLPAVAIVSKLKMDDK